ncbi:MAG TPA: hypothetical protein VGB13_02830 [Candidatus Krumholzibacteria bacterium]
MRPEDGHEGEEKRWVPAGEKVLQKKQRMPQKQHFHLRGLHSEALLG